MLKWLFTRITIFDDPDDDEYDGDLCESDHDFPMIRLNITLSPVATSEHRSKVEVRHEVKEPSHHESEEIQVVES